MKRKKNMMGRLAVTAVALTLISTSLMGSTLAKYATEITGTGTAAVAKWDVEMKADANAITASTIKSADYTFTLSDTRTANANDVLVAADKIAPGSSGSVALQINVKDTNEVKVGASFEIDTTNLNGVPIKFYSDPAMKTEIIFTGNKGTLTSTSTVAPKTTGAIDQVIYWKWETPTSNGDAADTTLGKAASSGTFKIKMIAEQQVK